MRRLIVRSLALAAATVITGAGAARAAELTDVASSFDEDNPFDLRLRVGYQYEQKGGAIKREGEGPGQQDVIVYKDLLYKHVRHSMSVRAEVGIFQDLAIFAELPFVLADSREYRFDQSEGSSCVYPPGTNGDPSTINCVNSSNSTTLNDGILPSGGYDATNAGAPFASGSDLVYRGVNRGGSGSDALDTINLGLNWGILSQKRDDTKPNWLLGIEADISFGNVMKFDRMNPNGNHGVSEGVHRLYARTAISRRFKYVEPYMGFWYMYPIARGDSLYVDYGTTQKFKDPQQQAGTQFGAEAVPWEVKDKQYKVAIDLRGRIEAKFIGRGYSEAWEILAASPALACDSTTAQWNPACDSTQNSMNMNTGYQNKPFTGITTIDNYVSLGGDVAIVVQAGKYVHFNIGLSYNRDQAHYITIDDVGIAFDPQKGNGCSVAVGGRVSRACEFNPAYRPVINEIGRRYMVDGMDVFKFGVWGQAMF